MLSAMDDNGEGKVTSIRQIVKFKEIFQKWQHVTLGPKGTDDSQSCDVYKGISPKISGKLTSSDIHSDTDEESCQSLEMPSDVPRGYLAVYVGPELRRFVIPTSYLSDPLFKVLLDKVEEEFGFDHRDGLTIPCDIEIFKYLLQWMENNRKERADRSNAGETSLSVNK